VIKTNLTTLDRALIWT